MDMMDPPSTATIDASHDVPSLSEPTTVSNDDAPVQSNSLDEPNTLPSEPCHPATTSSLKRRNTDGGYSGAKRQEQAFPFFKTFSEHHVYGDNIPVGYSWEEGNTQEHMYADTMPFVPSDNYSPLYPKSEILEICAENPCAGREDCEEMDGSFFGRAIVFHSLTGGNTAAYTGEQDLSISHNVSSYDTAPAREGDILSTNNKPSDGDEYSIASSHEEIMIELLDSSPDHLAQIPPSSVIRAVEGSFTPERFDPSLRRSTPRSSPKSCSVIENDQFGNPENLVDENIDWNEVVQHLPSGPKDRNTSQSLQAFTNTSQLLEKAMEWMESRSISPAKYQPLTRPAFPCPLRNKSPVEGISNSNVLMTCFRVGSVFQEVAHCLRADQEVTFELFARVSYTSREKALRIQHFQFVDLYEDQPPYVSGLLTGWKNNSALEKESAMFLDESMERMCRCICRRRTITKPEIRWDLEVLRIRPTSWKEIESVRGVICYQ